MKILLIFILSALSPFALSAEDYNLSALFEKMNGMSDGEFDFRGRTIRSWPGFNNEKFVDELISVIIEPKKTRDWVDALTVLSEVSLPKEMIVDKILSRVGSPEYEDSKLGRFMTLMRTYNDDPRAIPYFLRFIDDKRTKGRSKAPPGEENFGVAPRVCDGAAFEIRAILKKRGLLANGGNGDGVSGGDNSYEDADRRISALKVLLAENGLLDKKLDLPPSFHEKMMRNEADRAERESKNKPPIPASLTADGDKRHIPRSFAVVGTLVLLCGTFWLWWKRKSAA